MGETNLLRKCCTSCCSFCLQSMAWSHMCYSTSNYCTLIQVFKFVSSTWWRNDTIHTQTAHGWDIETNRWLWAYVLRTFKSCKTPFENCCSPVSWYSFLLHIWSSCHTHLCIKGKRPTSSNKNTCYIQQDHRHWRWNRISAFVKLKYPLGHTGI